MSEKLTPCLVKHYDNLPANWALSMKPYMGTVIDCFIDEDGVAFGPPSEQWGFLDDQVIPNPTEEQIQDEAAKAGRKVTK